MQREKQVEELRMHEESLRGARERMRRACEASPCFFDDDDAVIAVFF